MVTMIDEKSGVPFIHNTEELQLFLQPSYLISDILKDYDTYNGVMKKIINVVRGSFVIRECREFPIKFKFNEKEKFFHEIQLRHFMVNLILWGPFVELGDLDILNESFIIDPEKGIPHINDYINYKLIETLRDYHVKSTTLNYVLSQCLDNLRNISIDFSVILGLNFSAKTIIDMYENNDEIRNMMEVSFNEEQQPYEIEDILNRFEKREVEIYTKEKDNPIGVILRSQTGIKLKQLREFTISEGLKPTLDGVTVPKPIENSTMLKGLASVSDLYLDASGARKSLIMNKKVMGNAGHFGKIVLILARTLSMSKEVSNCNTKHLVEYEIKSKKHLKKLNGKYYKPCLLEGEEENPATDFKIVNANKDSHLIGKRIRVRSAVTCCLGDKVCPRCVGMTAGNNMDIADGLSAFESEEINKVVNQSILSTKHLLTTNSEAIKFNPEFDMFFKILCGEINPIVNDNPYVDNIEDYAIYIDPEDMLKMDEQDYDSLYNTVIHNGKFYIRNVKDPSQEDIAIQTEGEKEIFLSEDTIEFMKKGKGLIYFKDLDDDVKLFEVVVLNQELTRPLYELIDLLNKQRSKTGDDNIDETINGISQKMLDILIESNIDANVIAAELIINRLIRSVENKYERPDFTKDEIEPYEIYTVGKALEHNKSPLIGLSFQYIRRQILSDEFYEERHATSFVDPLYYKEIPTDNLKLYSKLIKEEEI